MARAFQTPSRRPLSVTPGFAALVIGVVLLAWFLRGTLMLVFAGALFGIVLYAAAHVLHRAAHVPVVACVWLVFVLMLVVLAGAAALGGGAFATQWAELQPTLRDAMQTAIRNLRGVPVIASAIASFDPSSLFSTAGPFLERAGGIVNTALGAVIAAVVILFVAVAGALEPALYRKGFLALWPPPERARLSRVLDDLVTTLRLWVVARLLSMFVTGLLVWLGLSILHVPLAGLLAVLAGALAFVPNIGAFVAAAPAVLIALAIGPRLAIAVVVMYWIVHLIDDFGISPFIERRIVRLPPILTLVAQITLAVVAGTLGIMLAAPLVAATLVIVQRLWIDQLEGRSS